MPIVARLSTGTFELGKVICVATHSGLWHWKWTPFELYSTARLLVKFSTKPLVEE